MASLRLPPPTPPSLSSIPWSFLPPPTPPFSSSISWDRCRAADASVVEPIFAPPLPPLLSPIPWESRLFLVLCRRLRCRHQLLRIIFFWQRLCFRQFFCLSSRRRHLWYSLQSLGRVVSSLSSANTSVIAVEFSGSSSSTIVSAVVTNSSGLLPRLYRLCHWSLGLIVSSSAKASVVVFESLGSSIPQDQYRHATTASVVKSIPSGTSYIPLPPLTPP